MQTSDQGVVIFAPPLVPAPFFTDREIAKLREVVSISLGGNANSLTDDDLSEFGRTLLEVTAVALRARAASSAAKKK